MKKILLSLLMLPVFIFTGCDTVNLDNQKEKDLIVYTSHSDSFSKEIIDKFEKETGINLYIVNGGTGLLLERLEKEKDEPLADIIWGGSISVLQENEALFDEYYSANENNIYDDYKNENGKITRFSVNPSVLIVNEKLSNGINIEGFNDLLNPKLKGKIIGAKPEKSSSGYEHLINQLYAMGDGNPDNGWNYVEELVNNIDGNLTGSSSTVYKKVISGDYVVGLTYEEPAVKASKEDDNIKVVYPKEGTIAKADGIALIKNCKQRKNAEKFLDFVTSKEVQQMMTSDLNRRAVRNDIEGDGAMMDFNSIKTITDDENWVLSNKQNILDKFNKCLDGGLNE